MNNDKLTIIIVCLISLIICLSGCSESHTQKKQAMVQQWEMSSASAKLPGIELLIEKGQYDKAKKELAKCIEANPDLAGACLLVGRINFLEGRNDQARQSFEHAVKLDPELDQGWHFLGSLAVLEKNYEQAISDFQKAIDLMPAKSDYLLSLSDVYIGINDLDKAQQVIDSGLEQQPRDLELILSKARLYQQMGNIDGAIRIYKQALLMHGDLPQILEPAAYAYIAHKQWASAAEKFALLIKQYPETDPRYNTMMRSLATCLLNSDQFAEAVYWYDKLSLLYRDDAEIWLDMAQASLGLDDPKRASYCAVNALKAKPSWPKAYAVLGSSRYMQGLYEQSLQAFYKITDDSELGAFAWFMSGRCYQQLGQNRQANAAFEKAEKLDPDNELIASFTKKTIHPL